MPAQIEDYHREIERSIPTSEITRGMGATRHFVFYNGRTVDEEVIRYEENKLVEYVTLNHTFPVAHMVGLQTLTAIDAETTLATFQITYQPKWCCIGWLLNCCVLRRFMGIAANGMLESLDHHIRTGEKIGKGWKAPK